MVFPEVRIIRKQGRGSFVPSLVLSQQVLCLHYTPLTVHTVSDSVTHTAGKMSSLPSNSVNPMHTTSLSSQWKDEYIGH